MLPAAPLAGPMLPRRAEVAHCRAPAGTEREGLGTGDEVPGADPDGEGAAAPAADGAPVAVRGAGPCRVVADVCTAGPLQAVASSAAQAAAAAAALARR